MLAGRMLGIMLFDFLRRMNTRWLYYALIGQGAVFAAMAIGNIWLRKKPALQYQFLFGDVNAFAGYLILQMGLLAGLWHGKQKLTWWAAASILFGIDSLMLVASWSRSGLVAYFGTILLYVTALAVMWIHRQHRRLLKTVALAGLVVIAAAAIYEHSQLFAAADNLYQGVKPLVPGVVRREVTARIVDLHRQFSDRVRLITPEVLYRQRVRDWAVPLTVVGDYPVFGIGVGAFYRNSLAYAKRAHRDQSNPDVFLYYVPENAHNYYLQIAAEAGIAGLILFLGFLVWLLSKHLTLTDPVKLGCGIALAGLMIFCMAQHPLLVDRVFFVFVMICAVMTGRQDSMELDAG